MLKVMIKLKWCKRIVPRQKEPLINDQQDCLGIIEKEKKKMRQ